MTRRRALLLATAIGIAVFAAVYAQKQPQAGKLLILEWANKSSLETPPVAVLIEFGQKDTNPTDWSGKATVSGAKIVHREGYRFREKAGDKLTDDGWTMKSHRGLRVPQNQPAVAKMEGIATVGVVLQLADITPDSSLSIETTGEEKSKSKVLVKDLLSGKPLAIAGEKGVVRLISTATPVVKAKTEDDFPAACYGPDGTLWVAWIGYHVQDDSRRIEAKNLKQQPDNFRSFYTPEFHDQLFVKYFKDGKWSEPIAVTGPNEDLVRCAMATEGNGTVWVMYSANRQGNYDLFARSIALKEGNTAKLQPEMRTTRKGTNTTDQVACTDQNGNVRCVFRRGDNEGTSLSPVDCTNGAWTEANNLAYGFGSGPWSPALAAGPKGDVTNVFDCQIDGDNDLVTYYFKSLHESVGNNPIITTSKYEARPSIAYDPAGRLWVAYEEGPELWGHDFGALAPNSGEPLYSSRSVRVVCLQDGKLMRPVAELPTSDSVAPHGIQEGPAWPKYERSTRYAYPKIGIDGKGRVWLTYRQKFGTRYSSHPGSYWLTFARRLDGDHWSEPIELHHSDGLLDSRPVLLPHKAGGLLVIHNTDGRFTTPETIDNDIYMSYVDLPGEPQEPKLLPHEPGTKKPELVQRAKNEAEAVKAIRAYRIENDGKEYRLLRGEFHRHTELSWDGGSDGSLEDMFRYAIDCAQLDWIGNGDHDNGAGREYSWWLVQKFTDAYTVPGRFTPMFCYERSVAYPHGHRNCVFAKRGVRTLPRLAESDSEKQVAGISPDDTKMLYKYLHELGGICASHTSATTMGTDWRDHDSDVEPLVEIYQGDRMSYEMEGAPRAGYEPKSGKEPVNIAGWKPLGFVDHALGEKGFKLGFESSSDHWSTHISYCVVLAEKHDRESILDGMKKRHVYGATDDIICDVKSGKHLMGDEFTTDAAPAFQVHVIGTKDLAKVEVLRDSKVIASLDCKGKECKEEWKDPTPDSGKHYYYVRVQQKDGELAWTSPMWIEAK
jgi:hypothetical protein